MSKDKSKSNEELATTIEYTERLERLETDNETLRSENETLRDRLGRLESVVESISPIAGDEAVEADGGETFKILGALSDENGIGVLGQNAADTGTPVGVRGHTTAGTELASTGVEGISDADANNAYASEIVPAGIHGKATGEGATHGVRGESDSLNGRGVVGFATSESYEHNTFTGSAIGVTGVTDRSGEESGLSDSGGVFGWATATSGSAYGVLGRNASSDGWGVLAMDTSGDGLALRASGDTELDGNHETTGDTDLGGELAFSDETPQRTAGPIAKGWINEDGSIENAVNVASAQWHSGEERYRINLSNEYYWFDDYVTVLAPVEDARFRTTSNSGDLIVEFRDDQGNLIQTMFQFVTYDLPSGAQTTSSSESTTNSSEPTGSDEEEANPDASTGQLSSR